MNIKVFTSHSLDPFVNLAYENSLLKIISPGDKWLFLYRNVASIVMGRFQNPWIECDFEQIKQDKVHLVRRQSGGGTVYHDENNLNYCFLHGTRDHHKDENHQVVLMALADLGIEAHANNRSDIKVFDHDNIEKKISGSAFKQKKDRSFHHGTLLLDTDLQILNRYLKSKNPEAESKGTKSNPSVVINLKDLSYEIKMDKLVEALSSNFYRQNGVRDHLIIKVEDYIDVDKNYLQELKSREWVLLETPYFVLNKKIGDFEFYIESKKGVILTIKIQTELVDPYSIGLLERYLEGRALEIDTLNLIEGEFRDYVELERSSLAEILEAMRALSIFV